MNTELTDLISQYRRAARDFANMVDAPQAEFDRQQALCRELRAQINALCPESETYDPNEGNTVK